MMAAIIFLHTILSLLLILIILMQSGRGGGLTEQFASAENIFGAQTSSFLVKGTAILTTLFLITSLSLAFLSSKKEKSLMATKAAEAKAVAVEEVQPPAEQAVQEAVTNQAVTPVSAQ